MLFAMRMRVASDGCSVRLKGLGQPDIFCRGLNGRVQRFKRFRRTEIRHELLKSIPKLDTMKSLNRVTVESRIFGPKKFRKVEPGPLVSN